MNWFRQYLINMALVYVLGTVHSLPYLMCSSVYFMDFEQISLAKIDKWQIFCLQKIPHAPADFYNTVANRFISFYCVCFFWLLGKN